MMVPGKCENCALRKELGFTTYDVSGYCPTCKEYKWKKDALEKQTELLEKIANTFERIVSKVGKNDEL